jgi:ketosteroid isomerase-like protein
MMTDSELRELCNRFFDAYENRLIDELRDIYADNCVIWNNVFDSEHTGAENIAALPKGYSRQRRRTYNDRRINTFPGGFVIQYTLNGVHHSGHKGALWAAIVALCHDGKIVRIDEYLDSSKFDEWRGADYEANLPEWPSEVSSKG